MIGVAHRNARPLHHKLDPVVGAFLEDPFLMILVIRGSSTSFADYRPIATLLILRRQVPEGSARIAKKAFFIGESPDDNDVAIFNLLAVGQKWAVIPIVMGPAEKAFFFRSTENQAEDVGTESHFSQSSRSYERGLILAGPLDILNPAIRLLAWTIENLSGKRFEVKRGSVLTMVR